MPRNVTFIKRDHSLAPGEKYNFIAAKLHIGLRNRETPYIRGAIDCRPCKRHTNTFLSGRDRGVQSARRPLTRDASGPGFRSAEPHRFRSTAQPTDPDRRPSVVVSRPRCSEEQYRNQCQRFVTRMQGPNICARPDN